MFVHSWLALGFRHGTAVGLLTSDRAHANSVSPAVHPKASQDYKNNIQTEQKYIFAGLLGGVLICLIVAVVELFTLNLLMRQTTKHRAMTYQGLVRF
jgi:hypothetical protein